MPRLTRQPMPARLVARSSRLLSGRLNLRIEAQVWTNSRRAGPADLKVYGALGGHGS